MANLTFPVSPSANQVYTNPITGHVYIYDEFYGHWKFASNNTLRGTSNDKNLIYDDNDEANGSNNLIFDRSSNTILANVISVYNLSASVLIANGINISMTIADSYDKANDANILAFNTGIAVNLYAAGVGTNVNVRTTAIGIGSNVLGNLAFTRANQSFNTIVVNGTVPGTRLVEGSVFPYPNFNLSSSNGVTLSAYSSNNTINIGLSQTGVTPTTYGSSEIINPLIVVDAYGRVTTASNVAVSNALLVGISANTYANGVGANANVYAGIMANSVNLYIRSVGIAANDFAGFAYDKANDSYDAANSINAQTAAVRNAANAANNILFNSSSLVFANVNVSGTLLTSANSRDTLSLTNANGITITATVSPQTVNVGLSPTGVVAGTYGSSTLSPWFQIDDYGRITNAGTNTPIVPKYQFTGPHNILTTVALPAGQVWHIAIRSLDWVFNGIPVLRLGTAGAGGAVVSTGYTSWARAYRQTSTNADILETTGFTLNDVSGLADGDYNGIITITRLSGTNIYVYDGILASTSDVFTYEVIAMAGKVTLGAAANAIRLDFASGGSSATGSFSIFAYN